MNQRIEAMRIKSVKLVETLVCSVIFLKYFKWHEYIATIANAGKLFENIQESKINFQKKIFSCLVTPLPGWASELGNDARHGGPWSSQYWAERTETSSEAGWVIC